MFIMGTAGHIDHGKTTLIKTLTGINPDRLREEQSRGMTVDLGFAWFSLPGGNVGVVDVPGHHRLVKNMLAGIGQLDFVLLVIAADDGWMPQTQEHVDILHLYGVQKGVVALTKADLVEEDWLELVEADIREHLAQTTLAKLPIVPVSAVTDYNLELLKEKINEVITSLPPAEDLADPLLWIDRVFTIKGAGTIVTGTLIEGFLEVGDEVMVEPLGRKARIRGLQTQTQVIDKGVPHSRLAVNLTGMEKEEITRGMYLCLAQKRPYYSLINSFVHMLPNAPTPLESGQEIKLYIGTHEALTGVRILGGDKIGAGEEGFAQLELESPAHFNFGDRFILRHSELQDTLGGGSFIEEGIPVRGSRLRLVGPNRLNHLFPFEKPQAYLDLGILAKKHAADRENLSLLVAEDRIFWTRTQFYKKGLPIHSNLLELGEYLMAPGKYQKLQRHLEKTVQDFHEKNPLAPGLQKETLRTTAGIPSRLFDEVLRRIPSLEETQGMVRKKTHKISFTSQEEKQLEEIIEIIEKNPYEPPSLAAFEEQGFKRELIYGAEHLGNLVLLAAEAVTTPKILHSVQGILLAEEAFREEFQLATFRDRLQTSRKFALAFLEYFDAEGITIRKGDVRVLGRRPRD